MNGRTNSQYVAATDCGDCRWKAVEVDVRYFTIG